MLDFPRWKTISILLICASFIMLALPNVLTPQQREALPEWMPKSTVSLGLDLQGGVHLLLKVDFDAYLKEHLEAMTDQLRAECRDAKLRCSSLSVYDGKIIRFSLAPDAEGNQPDAAKLLWEVDPDLTVINQEGSAYEVAYSDAGLRTMRNKVIEKSILIVGRRVDETGTREPIIQQQGDDRIVVQVPGLDDPELLKDIIGQTAKMTFHLVDDAATQTQIMTGRVTPLSMVLPSQERDERGVAIKYAVKRRALLSGENLVDASVGRDEMGRPAVNFRFNPVGAKKFGEITTENVGKPFAIVLDGEVITAPRINEPILGGSGIISGSYTAETASKLALLLRSGALPAPLKIIEERTVGPSLGADSIAAGEFASLVGIILVFIFMLVAYGLFGVFANLALIMNVIIILACLSLFNATLTLPGIAGIALTIGMAVDANVLIYERVREEISRGKGPFASLESGFRLAFNTIFDSNITTLIAAFLLYYYGTGTVKGFAVTLSIGILSSMFSAVVLTRLMIATWVRKVRPKTLPI